MNNQERRNSRRKIRTLRTLRLTGNIIFFVLVGFMILYFFINTIDINTGYNFPFLGLRSSVIVSESMAYRNPVNTYLTEDMHQIDKNDLIITYNYRSYEDIKLYDVLTYNTDTGLICHRVVDKYEFEGKQYIVTRGDSNAINDAPFEYSLVKGKVVGVIPKVGGVALFLQSPYSTIAIFGSLFFLFFAWFLISIGSYGEYKDLKGINREYEEDKVIVINGEKYNQSKSKKNYKLIGGDNHYRIKIKGDEVVLERIIRTDYESKIDKSIVSGIYDEEELEKTLVTSVLPLAVDLILDGYNPLRNIRNQLLENGTMKNDIHAYRKANKQVFKRIKIEQYLDINKASKEDKKKYRMLFRSYRRFKRYLSSYINMDLEKADKMYSYLYYCLKNDIDPMSNFRKEKTDV